MVKAVRGAISLDSDTEKDLQDKVSELYKGLQELNGFKEEDIISIIFSQTRDISYNPAKALRINCGLSFAPLFCTQEPECVDFQQEMMLRVLVTFNSCTESRGKPLYLGKAAELRTDIVG